MKYLKTIFFTDREGDDVLIPCNLLSLAFCPEPFNKIVFTHKRQESKRQKPLASNYFVSI